MRAGFCCLWDFNVCGLSNCLLFGLGVPRSTPTHSHPGYFGKVGMRHFHLKRNPYHCPTINVDKLWSLMSAAEQEKTKTEAGKGSGVAPIIDANAKVCGDAPLLPVQRVRALG
jgi:hypothetical protein